MIQTGIGPVEVQRVKLRDRGAEVESERIRFTSAICRAGLGARAASMLCCRSSTLRGVSMGDFQEALGALLGKDAPNLSPSVIARLRGEWEADFKRWQRRDLSARRYVYIWAKLAKGSVRRSRMEGKRRAMGFTCRRAWNRRCSACWC